MPKKSIFILFALLLISSAFISAQDMDKINKLSAEIKAIDSQIRARGGQPTPQEVQRIQQIQAELVDAYAGPAPAGTQPQGQYNQVIEQTQRLREKAMELERQKEQQAILQGAKNAQNKGKKRGWPPAAAFQFYNLPPLKQPAGTSVSYTSYANELEWLSFEVYIGGIKPEIIIQDLKRQVEAATKKTMDNGNNADSYILEMDHPHKEFGGMRIEIVKSDDYNDDPNYVVFSIGSGGRMQ